jgi:response regulator RpfG family c-di-GMP phosphodiesterase
MNGLEIAKALRSHPTHGAAMRLIGTTAFATIEVQRQCMDAGMDAFLPKPLRASDIVMVLRGAAREPSVRTEVSHSSDFPGRGLLGEMQGKEDWDTLKSRWLAIFDTHVESVDACVANNLEATRKAAHKLLGHLRMIDAGSFAEILVDLMTAAHAGDHAGVQAEWAVFKSRIPAFRPAFKALPES